MPKTSLLRAAAGSALARLGPGGVSSGIVAWWDASTTTYVTLEAEAGDDEIVSFTDRSGNGKTLTRDADGKGFLQSPGEVNGLAAGYNLSNCGYAANLGTLPQPFQVFAVVKLRNTANRTLLSSNTDAIMLRQSTTSGGLFYMYGGNNDDGVVPTLNTFSLIHANWGTTTMAKFQNGTQLGSTDSVNNTGASITNPLRVGRNNADGEDWTDTARFCEMVIYSRILSGADLTAVKTYFANKYALTIA